MSVNRKISNLPAVVGASILDADILPLVASGVTSNTTIADLRIKLGTNPPAGGRTVTDAATYLANNAVFNVKDFGAFGDNSHNDTTAIQAAITAAQNNGDGSRVYFPPGTYLFNAQIAPTKALIFEGGAAGTDNAGQHSGPILTWTGGATTAIKFAGVGATNSQMIGFLINNTGTATVAIDIDVGHVRLVNVAIVSPTTAFSVAGIRVGVNASVPNPKFFDVVLRGAAPINVILGQINAFLVWRGGSIMDPSAGGTVSLQVGTATQRADFVHFEGTSFESTTVNIANIQIIRAQEFSCHNCYFEITGASAVALDIPNTAVVAAKIRLVDCRLGAISGSPYAVRSNFASATLRIEDCFLDGTFTGLLNNLSLRHALVAKNQYTGSALPWTSNRKGVTQFQNENAGGTIVRADGYFMERDFVSSASNGNVNTGETDLTVDTLDANRLYEQDQMLRVFAWGITAANANTKQVKLYVGGVVVLDSTAIAANNKPWYVEALVFRNGATTAVVYASGQFNGAPIQATHTGIVVASTGWDAAQILKVTGTAPAGLTNDITQKGMLVEVSN